MTVLPDGWEQRTLGDFCAIHLGKTPPKLEQRLIESPRTDRSVPFYKVGDMNGDVRRLSTARVHLAPEEVDGLGLKLLEFGTVVFPKAGGAIATNKKRSVEIPGAIDLNCMGVKAGPAVDDTFLYWWFQSVDLVNISDGSVLPQLSRRAIAGLRVPVPSLEEQLRIVAVLEDHLSRLDAADRAVGAARTRLEKMYESASGRAYAGIGRRERLENLAEVRLGRQRSPANHSGPSMRPYLRAANVTWDGISLLDVKEMAFTDKEMDSYRLEPDDILLSEASGSPTEVGKPALWEGQITDCAFQNTLLRVRPHSIRSDFLLHYFRYYARSGGFARSARGVGIHHLGRAALAELLVPNPDQSEQDSIVMELDAIADQSRRILETLTGSRARSLALRRSLLNAAFTGQLTGGSRV